MNTYIINSTLQFDGEPLGTIKANSIEEAEDQAKFLYGPDVVVTRQYATTALGIDPLWILLGILLVARLASGRKRSK